MSISQIGERLSFAFRVARTNLGRHSDSPDASTETRSVTDVLRSVLRAVG
ncbi:hypothetical protein [Mycobacterium sp. URHB0044]|jgi:hypothetical protein|nr:hypothetical protein [Mycobacterium sp. URHB0044]